MFTNLLKKLILLSVILFTFGLSASANIGTVIIDYGRHAQDDIRDVTIKFVEKSTTDVLNVLLIDDKGNKYKSVKLDLNISNAVTLQIKQGTYKVLFTNTITGEQENLVLKID